MHRKDTITLLKATGNNSHDQPSIPPKTTAGTLALQRANALKHTKIPIHRISPLIAYHHSEKHTKIPNAERHTKIPNALRHTKFPRTVKRAKAILTSIGCMSQKQDPGSFLTPAFTFAPLFTSLEV